ncbi:MAG: hypothetical protein Q7U89_00155, partial [Coriobacteriia bacterium]|nr:hypothetical protein [Coriobacteriia bacterium]
MALLFVVGTLVTLAIGGVAYAVSAFSNGGGRVSAIVGGALGVMWLLNFIASVNKSTEFLNKFSIFYYWEPGRIIDEVATKSSAWWAFGLVASIFPIVAVWRFMRRDVAA